MVCFLEMTLKQITDLPSGIKQPERMSWLLISEMLLSIIMLLEFRNLEYGKFVLTATGKDMIKNSVIILPETRSRVREIQMECLNTLPYPSAPIRF